MSVNVEKSVIEIISDQLGTDASKITRDTDIANDLGADSLDFAELMIAFEEKFEIDIDEENATNIKTVGSVIDHVQAALDAEGKK